MTFTKRDTEIGKGVAVLLLFTHHLFTFKDRLHPGVSYTPLLFFVNIEYYIGFVGKICVSLFLFLTGYGLTLSLENSGRPLVRYLLRKTVHFYGMYWSYFVIFIPIGIFLFPDVTHWHSTATRFVADPETILLNLLGLSYSYNDEWWFVRVYLEVLLLIYPFFFWLRRQGTAYLVLGSGILYGISTFWDTPNHLLYWQASVAMGILLATNGKALIEIVFNRLGDMGVPLLFLSAVLCIMLRFRLTATDDLFIGPVFLLITVQLARKVRLDGALALLGRYSLPLWLSHSYICYYFLQKLVYWPRYSPLVLAMLVALSLSTVLLIERVRSAAVRRLFPQQPQAG